MSEGGWVSRTTGPGIPIVERGNTGWLRARLARDLHDRFYGLQARPVTYGTGLVTLALATPHCRRAPRGFGKLADDRASTHTSYQPDQPAFSKAEDHVLFGEPWASGDEQRAPLIGTLSTRVDSTRSGRLTSSLAGQPLPVFAEGLIDELDVTFGTDR